MSKSDPFVVIKWKTDTEENWREIGEIFTDSFFFPWLASPRERASSQGQEDCYLHPLDCLIHPLPLSG